VQELDRSIPSRARSYSLRHHTLFLGKFYEHLEGALDELVPSLALAEQGRKLQVLGKETGFSESDILEALVATLGARHGVNSEVVGLLKAVADLDVREVRPLPGHGTLYLLGTMMSMMGLAISPGTEIDPACSIRSARSPRAARIFAASRSNSTGHSGS